MMLLVAAACRCSPPRPPPAAGPPRDYSKPANWLCLPGRTDICSTPLADHRAQPQRLWLDRPISPVAKDPRIDCFYVYPTVSRDQGINSDLIPGDGEEKAAVAAQFARFAGACRIFAPIYRADDRRRGRRRRRRRRLSRPPLPRPMATCAPPGRNISPSTTRAARSCSIGHSQGSWMLQTLIANEIEGKPDGQRR